MTEEHKEHIVCHQSRLDFSNLAERNSPLSEEHSLLTEEHKEHIVCHQSRVLTSIISINWGEFVIFVLPTKDKHYSYIRSAGQINSLPYKLTKTKLLANTSTH